MDKKSRGAYRSIRGRFDFEVEGRPIACIDFKRRIHHSLRNGEGEFSWRMFSSNSRVFV